MEWPESFSLRRKPAGLFKWLLGSPLWLYRLRLGFLFGERLLVLVHRGRRSGLVRETVLEVVAVQEGDYYVCSGTGPRADWYLNIQQEPALEVWVGSRRFRPVPRLVPPEEAAGVFAEYESAHPRLARRLLSLMGNSYDGTDDGRVAMMAEMPMVVLAER